MHAYYQPFLSKNRDIQLAKETWEYAVADSIPDGDWVGAGKNVVDVSTLTAEIDVKGISVARVGRSLTTEASFLQNNKLENDSFATLFQEKDFRGLKNMFVDLWLDKVKDTKNLHLFAAIREKSNQQVHYCLLKVEDDPELTEDRFVEQMTLSGGRTVDVPLIDSVYGKTYLYIPKRRLEIRLNTNGLEKYIVHSHNYEKGNQ